ncbi:MAG TPA: TetR family transcriptional regulator [Actinomycetales bacterium]|nr:TetR family transcriptional regulator [Actinomycetales bacterium]
MRSADDDLTARATIRNAALQLFADLGPDAVSVRAIASAAGVSPALVLHHFGSKAGLREAVNRYAADRIDVLIAESEQGAAELFATGSADAIAGLFAAAFPPDSPLVAYLRRLLLTGDQAGVDMFRRWFSDSLAMFDEMAAAGLATPSDDPPVRAAFMLAADMALLLLREPLAAVLGFDPMSRDGLRRWAAEVAQITRDGIFTTSPEEPTEPQPRDQP